MGWCRRRLGDVADEQVQGEPPAPTPLVPRPRFSPWLLEEFTRAAIEWTREHHPERLKNSGGEQNGQAVP